MKNKKNFQIEKKVPKRTVDMLEKAWKELPTDYTMNERMMFIEFAERIIKISDLGDGSIN